MRMAADGFTPVSDKLIPTGEVASVAGTVFDLRYIDHRNHLYVFKVLS